MVEAIRRIGKKVLNETNIAKGTRIETTSKNDFEDLAFFDLTNDDDDDSKSASKPKATVIPNEPIVTKIVVEKNTVREIIESKFDIDVSNKGSSEHSFDSDDADDEVHSEYVPESGNQESESESDEHTEYSDDETDSYDEPPKKRTKPTKTSVKTKRDVTTTQKKNSIALAIDTLSKNKTHEFKNVTVLSKKEQKKLPKHLSKQIKVPHAYDRVYIDQKKVLSIDSMSGKMFSIKNQPERLIEQFIEKKTGPKSHNAVMRPVKVRYNQNKDGDELVKAKVVKRYFFPKHKKDCLDIVGQYRLIFKDKFNSSIEYHVDPAQTYVNIPSMDFKQAKKVVINYNEWTCCSKNNITGHGIASCSVKVLPPEGVKFDEDYLDTFLLSEINVRVPRCAHSLEMCEKEEGKYFTRNDINENIHPNLIVEDSAKFQEILNQNRTYAYAYNNTN